MDLKKNLCNFFKLVVVIIIYIVILFSIAPLVDYSFTSLHKDESNMEIMGEIILQLIAVSVIWYYLNTFIFFVIKKYINISRTDRLKSVIGIVSGLMFVGLQTHLKNKLSYITHEHPFRIFQFL